MKLRLTPLNIVSSILLIFSAYLIVFSDNTGWRKLGAIPLLVMFFLSFLADVVFRRFLKDLGRIWIIETVFIIFVAVLIILIQKQSV